MVVSSKREAAGFTEASPRDGGVSRTGIVVTTSTLAGVFLFAVAFTAVMLMRRKGVAEWRTGDKVGVAYKEGAHSPLGAISPE